MRNKLNDRAVDAFAENNLLPHEVTPQVREGAATKHRKRVADQLARVRKARRDESVEQSAPAGAILSAIAGRTVFTEQDCRGTELVLALRKHALQPARADARGRGVCCTVSWATWCVCVDCIGHSGSLPIEPTIFAVDWRRCGFEDDSTIALPQDIVRKPCLRNGAGVFLLLFSARPRQRARLQVESVSCGLGRSTGNT